jgi:hypothetical protein
MSAGPYVVLGVYFGMMVVFGIALWLEKRRG